MKAYVEPQEISMMEQATTNLRDNLLIRLLFHLGCRITEALSLMVGDIDFDNSKVTIIHLKSSLRLFCLTCGARLGRSHTFCPGCGGKLEKTQIEQQQYRRNRVLPVDVGL